MILSLVRSLNKDDLEPEPSMYWLREHLGFLMDEHLMNVGLTRARKGLCIIGMLKKCYVVIYTWVIPCTLLAETRKMDEIFVASKLSEIKLYEERTSTLSYNSHRFPAVLKNCNGFILKRHWVDSKSQFRKAQIQAGVCSPRSSLIWKNLTPYVSPSVSPKYSPLF